MTFKSSFVLGGTFVASAIVFLAARSLSSHPQSAVQLSPASRNLGTLSAGEHTTVSFEILNRTGAQLTVLGCKTGCGCLVVEGLPLSVPPGGMRTIDAKLVPQKVGAFRHKVELLTDCIGWVGPSIVDFEVEGIEIDTDMPLEPIAMTEDE